MTVTFDTTNKWILLPDLSPNYTITAQEIYNSAMDWCDSQEAMDYEVPLRSSGYANLGGGAYSDKIFILQKGWKLKPYSGTYTLTVIGTLIALDDNGDPYDRTVPPDSGTVIWIFQVSSQGIISVIGSGVTEQDKQDIANLVWTITDGLNVKERVELVKKIETNKWKIINNQLIIYDDDGVTPIRTFNLKDASGNPSEQNVYERQPTP